MVGVVGSSPIAPTIFLPRDETSVTASREIGGSLPGYVPGFVFLVQHLVDLGFLPFLVRSTDPFRVGAEKHLGVLVPYLPRDVDWVW